eukprot:Sspe_Gene.15686::Locus_5466_Transcript_1_1_Confidence_1.000_Length_4322::g.15686::m.15686/K13293/PDE4; cAMP-specific phosphodiesterase 4
MLSSSARTFSTGKMGDRTPETTPKLGRQATPVLGPRTARVPVPRGSTAPSRRHHPQAPSRPPGATPPIPRRYLGGLQNQLGSTSSSSCDGRISPFSGDPKMGALQNITATASSNGEFDLDDDLGLSDEEDETRPKSPRVHKLQTRQILVSETSPAMLSPDQVKLSSNNGSSHSLLAPDSSPVTRTLTPMLSQGQQGNAHPFRHLSSRQEYGYLFSMDMVDGVLYFIRNGAIEFLQIEASVDGAAAGPIVRHPRDAEVLKAHAGVPSYLTWDNFTAYADRSIRLEEDDSCAVPANASAQGTVVGMQSFSEGIHMWTIEFTDILGITFGIVSRLGVDSFDACRSGTLPPYVASLRPGSRLQHRIHWRDAQGQDQYVELDPPLSHYLYSDGALNELSVVLNFYHGQITFLCNGCVLRTVQPGRVEDCQVNDVYASSSLIGHHTVFAHLKYGARVKLCNSFPRSFNTLMAGYEGIPNSRYLVGNPYLRWHQNDGMGTEASFKLPLGITSWNGFLWVTDCDTIRQIDPTQGRVMTRHLTLVPYDCQPPIQYLGAIHAMRNRLYVTDLTNRTVLCVDPHTWEARLVLNKGEHGFRPCGEERRRRVARLIGEMRIYDTAVANFGMTVEKVVANACTELWGCDLSLDTPCFRFGLLGLAHVPPAWLFVTDTEQHTVFCADLAANGDSEQGSNEKRNTPQVCAGCPGQPGKVDGQGADARLCFPTSIVGDPNNLTLFVSDTGNNRIVKVQLVWNDIKRQYSAQLAGLHHFVPQEDDEDVPLRIREPVGLALHPGIGSFLVSAEPHTDTLYQIHLQDNPRVLGPAFSSPYDHIVMLMRQAKRDAENMPEVNVEHCKMLGRALDLLLSTPNIYQMEYVGGTIDDDIARFLSDSYSPQGVVDAKHRGGSPHGEGQGNTRFGDPVSRVLGVDLEGLDSINFNVFEATRTCEDHGGVLLQVAMNIFAKYRFFTKYFSTQESYQRLIQFLSKIQAGYHKDNPYHNHIHAADVLQTLHWMINATGIVTKISDIDCFSLLLSAVIHDYDHPGVNNAFLVNTQDELALQFNDQSVLENHHLQLSFQLLRVETYAILAGLTEQEQKQFRENTITFVLGTDMKSHFSALGNLKTLLQRDSEQGIDLLQAVSEDAKKDDKMLILKQFMHAADISNPTKPRHLCLEWTRRVMKEFREQGKKEEELGLPVSPFCEEGADVVRCQKGFIEFVVRPLFAAFADFNGFKPMMENLDANLAYWKDLEAKHGK